MKRYFLSGMWDMTASNMPLTRLSQVSLRASSTRPKLAISLEMMSLPDARYWNNFGGLMDREYSVLP
jgi:hypothetical protein